MRAFPFNKVAQLRQKDCQCCGALLPVNHLSARIPWGLDQHDRAKEYGPSALHATVPAGGLGELVEHRENVGVALPTLVFIQLRGDDEAVVFQPVQSISDSAYEGDYQT